VTALPITARRAAECNSRSEAPNNKRAAPADRQAKARSRQAAAHSRAAEQQRVAGRPSDGDAPTSRSHDDHRASQPARSGQTTAERQELRLSVASHRLQQSIRPIDGHKPVRLMATQPCPVIRQEWGTTLPPTYKRLWTSGRGDYAAKEPEVPLYQMWQFAHR